MNWSVPHMIGFPLHESFGQANETASATLGETKGWSLWVSNKCHYQPKKQPRDYRVAK